MNKAIKLLQSSKKDWTTKELQAFWKIKNKNTLYTTIKRYVKQGVLFRIKKGEYSTKPRVSLEWLQDRKSLWWWVEDVEGLSEESIVEGVMNYGRWRDFLFLKKVIGLSELNHVFNRMTKNRGRVNLRPEKTALFENYFNRYATN